MFCDLLLSLTVLFYRASWKIYGCITTPNCRFQHCHIGDEQTLWDPDWVPADPYRGHRFPEEIISQCAWLYFNFCVSFRDVELMMAFRGVQL